MCLYTVKQRGYSCQAYSLYVIHGTFLQIPRQNGPEKSSDPCPELQNSPRAGQPQKSEVESMSLEEQR